MTKPTIPTINPGTMKISIRRSNNPRTTKEATIESVI
jgi:hypothetical protein